MCDATERWPVLLIALLQDGGEGGGGEGAARWSVDLEEAVGGSRQW